MILNETFRQKYPYIERNVIGSGVYGKVYQSGNFAIKVTNNLTSRSQLASFCREINIYSQTSHPCVAQMLDYTIDYQKNVGMMAFSLGIPIITAVKTKVISIREVISDLLSALSHLH